MQEALGKYMVNEGESEAQLEAAFAHQQSYINEMAKIKDMTLKLAEKMNTDLALVEEKIKALGDLIGSKDYSKKKTTDAKWVVLAREQSRISESLSSNLFWRDSHSIVIAIAKWISERTVYEDLKKIETQRNEEKIWCKQYMVEKTELGWELLNSMSEPAIIELAHNRMKIEYTRENNISGDKCYCEAHEGNRHYHFADTYWDGKQVIVFESSETY